MSYAKMKAQEAEKAKEAAISAAAKVIKPITLIKNDHL